MFRIILTAKIQFFRISVKRIVFFLYSGIFICLCAYLNFVYVCRMKKGWLFRILSAIRLKHLISCLLVMTTGWCQAQICGCTDSLATNYNAAATINDGSCEYENVIIEATEIGTLDSLLDGSSTLFFWNGGYWTFNDHNDNCLYLIDSTDATIMNTLCINGLISNDMEEISQDSLYLYFGDVGNNRGNRHDLRILRISKESILNQTFAIDTIAFTYEDQTDFTSQPQATDYDCEAFVVTDDSIYLFTKQWVSTQTTIYSLPKTPGTHIAQRRETYNVNGLITGVTYLPEYQLLVLCGYTYGRKVKVASLRPFIVLLYDYKDNRFFSGNKRRLNFKATVKSQVEAIATHNGLDYYITNEHFKTTVMGIPFDLPAALKRVDLRDYLLPYLSQFGVSDNQTVIQDFKSVDDIRIYPNPASNLINIDYPQTFLGATYEILDLNGRKVAEGVLENNTISLNSNNMPAGEYILRIRKDGALKTLSFIKKM